MSLLHLKVGAFLSQFMGTCSIYTLRKSLKKLPEPKKMDRGKRRSRIWKFKKIVLIFSGWSIGPGSPEILLDLLIPNKIQVAKRAPLTIISSASRSYTMVIWSSFFWCPEKTWVLSFSRVSLHPKMMKSKNNEFAPLKHGEFGVSTCFTALGVQNIWSNPIKRTRKKL